MAELHTIDLTNLRLMKSHFLFHEIFLAISAENATGVFFGAKNIPTTFPNKRPLRCQRHPTKQKWYKCTGCHEKPIISS